MGLSVTRVQVDCSRQQLKRLFGARIRMLAVEEQGADKTFPRIQALRRLSFQAVMFSSIDAWLNAAYYTFGNFVLDSEYVVKRPIVAFCP